MRCYRLTNCNPGLYVPTTGRFAIHVGTMAEAREILRSIPRDCREDVDIAEIEVPTDKTATLLLLNGESLKLDIAVLRRWEGCPRGGMKINADEEAAA